GTTTLRSREGNPLLRHLGPARVRHACVRPTGTARVRPHGDRARPPPRGPRTSMPKHGPRSPHLGSCLLTSNAPARSAAAAVAGSAWWSRWHTPGSCRLWGVPPCPPTPTRAGPFHVKRVAVLPATAMGPRCPDEPISARSTHHGWSGEHSAGDAPHVRRWLAIARGRPRLPSRGRVRPIDRSPHRISSEAAEQLSPPATPNKTLDGST